MDCRDVWLRPLLRSDWAVGAYRFLFFDTETTGKWIYDRPHSYSEQPHLVQLGALLTNADGAIAAQLEFIVKPEGWHIPDEVTKIHGITTEIALAHGLTRKTVIGAFNMLCRKADTVIAYNIDFDYRVMQANCYREFVENGMEKLKRECAMRPCTKICQIPKASGNGIKFPKLEEAYQHFFGIPMVGAHSALADTLACSKVWFELQKLKEPALPLEEEPE